MAVNGGVTRRSVLAASLAAPLLAAAGCGGPAAATPPIRRPSDVEILREAITAKKNLIGAYTAVLASHPDLGGQLEPLLADNRAHLAELQRRLIEPSRQAQTGTAGPSRQPSPPPAPADRNAALTALRSAERTAAGTHVAQLRTVTPSLAQLLASIAACEATHEVALTARPTQGRLR
jgi:hypothetical protein